MGDRSRLALVVGLTYLLVQGWTRMRHLLMIVFTPLSSQSTLLYFWVLGLAISASKVGTRRPCSERLGWIGTIGWPPGAMVVLTRGAI